MRASTLSLNHKALRLTAGIGILCFGLAAAQPSIQQPHIARGAIIAAQGVAGRAPACAQCHAYNGASDGSGAFPRIAGQSAFYLAKELRDYASGVRASAVMTPVAKALSANDTADVAAYYASVSAPYLPLSSADAMLIGRGKQLATIGDAAKELHFLALHVNAVDQCFKIGRIILAVDLGLKSVLVGSILVFVYGVAHLPKIVAENPLVLALHFESCNRNGSRSEDRQNRNGNNQLDQRQAAFTGPVDPGWPEFLHRCASR